MNVVIANMMLCHVPDMEKALPEVRRVMKDSGVFYCATFEEQGPASFVRKALGIPKEDGGVFMLENGASILKNRFSHVTKKEYKDALAVTDTHDLIDYIRTLSWAPLLNQLSADEVYDALEGRKENGVLTISKVYGLFAALK